MRGPSITPQHSREEARFSTRQSFQKMHKIKGKKQQPFRGDMGVV
jgi:hypothetical protein